MGVLDEAAREIISRVVNRTGEHKDLYCARCHGFTDHVSISHARYVGDLFEFKAARAFVWITGKLNDVNPVTNLLGRPFKCTKCGDEMLD
jgi:hypothetical protein